MGRSGQILAAARRSVFRDPPGGQIERLEPRWLLYSE